MLTRLKERHEPIRVAVLGVGWFGSRLVREIERFPGMVPAVAIDKIEERAIRAFDGAGIPKRDIAVVRTGEQLRRARSAGKRIAFSDLGLIREMEGIDAIYECTGDVLGGAQSAVYAAERGIHFVTVSAEMDATVGLRLAKIAEERGIVYSNSDGDQPGCLARMIHEVTAYGFEPKIVGNCKGFLDFHQNPVGIRPFVLPGHDLNKVCAFADGTKQSFEMATVANAFGYAPLKRGMHGLTTTKRTLVRDFDAVADLGSLKGGHVDFALGIDGVDQGAGVFVIARKEGGTTKEDMSYLKKGDGPHYLFFRDHHLCHLEAVSSITDAVLFGMPTIRPRGRFVDVFSVAKRGLKPGQKLDGLGGFDYYGLVESARTAESERLLPVGLAEFATMRRAAAADEPITYDMVDLQENLVTALRREQDEMAAEAGAAA